MQSPTTRLVSEKYLDTVAWIGKQTNHQQSLDQIETVNVEILIQNRKFNHG
jgi:hypothetical protein